MRDLIYLLFYIAMCSYAQTPFLYHHFLVDLYCVKSKSNRRTDGVFSSPTHCKHCVNPTLLPKTIESTVRECVASQHCVRSLGD